MRQNRGHGVEGEETFPGVLQTTRRTDPGLINRRIIRGAAKELPDTSAPGSELSALLQTREVLFP